MRAEADVFLFAQGHIAKDLSGHGGGSITLVKTELDDIGAASFIFADAVDGV